MPALRCRCTPSPNQTPACRGLVTLKLAGSGQARSRLGEGLGVGVAVGEHASRNNDDPHPDPPPFRGRERTEIWEREQTEIAVRLVVHASRIETTPSDVTSGRSSKPVFAGNEASNG